MQSSDTQKCRVGGIGSWPVGEYSRPSARARSKSCSVVAPEEREQKQSCLAQPILCWSWSGCRSLGMRLWSNKRSALVLVAWRMKWVVSHIWPSETDIDGIGGGDGGEGIADIVCPNSLLSWRVVPIRIMHMHMHTRIAPGLLLGC